jgi:hypothetical protein
LVRMAMLGTAQTDLRELGRVTGCLCPRLRLCPTDKFISTFKLLDHTEGGDWT